MAEMNWPTSPTEGDVYTNTENQSFVFDGCKWVATCCPPTGAFIFTVDTTGYSADFTIPTNFLYLYNYDVYWESRTDSTVFGSSTGNSGDYTITFPTGGSYRIFITGDFPHYYGLNSTDYLKLTSIEQWGNIVWSSMDTMFFLCQNLEYIAIDAPNLKNVSSLSYMFYGCASIVNTLMNNWDTSNVIDMSYAFTACNSFNGRIDYWDTSNVVNFDYMLNSTAFNGDISRWDVSSAVSMNNMLSGSNFNQNVGSWEVGSVLDMTGLFGATPFNNGGSNSINNWDTSVATSMSGMFQDAILFNQDIGLWDVGSVQYMSYMFNGAYSFDQDITGWCTENVQSMDSMFLNASSFSYNLSSWCVRTVSPTPTDFDTGSLIPLPLPNWGAPCSCP